MRKSLSACTACLLFSLVLIPLFAFTACSSREAPDSATFLSLLEGKGYETEEVAAEPGLDVSYVAYLDDIYWAFSVASSVDEATAAYNITLGVIETMKGSGSTHSSASAGNYDSYTLTTGESYYSIGRIGNAILLAQGPKSEKSTIQDIVKELGY